MARALKKPEWRPYLDLLSHALIGKSVQIEVASLELGDQVEVEWLPLLGIAYDPKDDIVQIALEGVDHLVIHAPQTIEVEGEGPAVSSLEIIDIRGAQQIVQLRDPLMLPAPH